MFLQFGVSGEGRDKIIKLECETVPIHPAHSRVTPSDSVLCFILSWTPDSFLQLPGTWFIYVGSLPISLGFLSIAAFSYYDSWDPVFIALKKLVHCFFRFRCCFSAPRGKSHSRTRSAPSASDSIDLKEQKESLILNEQKCASSWVRKYYSIFIMTLLFLGWNFFLELPVNENYIIFISSFMHAVSVITEKD